jgi:hypothetical protein
MLPSYCGSQSGGPLGCAELILTDDNGDEHIFAFETFFIRYRGRMRIRVKSGHKVGGWLARARLVISPTVPRLT